jgi:hypothetical protein
MSERERQHGDGEQGDLLEQGWQALCAAADLPLSPSEALQHRVRDLASRHAPASPDARKRWLPPVHWWWPAAGLAAAMLLIFLALAGTRQRIREPLRAPAPGLAQDWPGGDAAPKPLPAPPQPRLPRERKLAERLDNHLESIRKQSPHSPLMEDDPTEHPLLPAAPRPSPREDRNARTQASRREDLEYLNRHADQVMQQWTSLPTDEWDRVEAQVRRSVRVQDDFVQIPFPRLAATSGRQVTAAVEGYKREAAVVDSRLFRKVTLQLKGVSLEELCAALQTQTGVDLRAARGVSDEKVTVFVKERPAREVMRAMVQLFGYTWLRSKKEDQYRYELAQDLRSQLAEEELRNRDTSAALLALDREMEAYRPYLALSFDQLSALYSKAKEPERLRLQKITQMGGWGGMQLYFRLTPAERAALLSGRKLLFSLDAPDPDRRLEADWVHVILQSQADSDPTSRQPRSLADIPGATLSTVALEMDRSELGRIKLKSVLHAVLDAARGSSLQAGTWLADVRSPARAKPDNAKANERLRGERTLQTVVSLHPEAACAAAQARPSSEGRPKLWPHVFSSDVWEAVHRASGQDVVADFYTRPYQTTTVTVERDPLFEALCQVADAMGVRWRREGDLLLGRSTSFFWDRVKEIPNRHLARWQQAKREHGGLPLESLIEMASLTDEQLSAGLGTEAIIHCWGLDEWRILGTAPGATGIEVRVYGDREPWLMQEHWYPESLTAQVRFFGTLTPEQRTRALRSEGIAVGDLTPEQQRRFLQLWNQVEEQRERRKWERPGVGPQPLHNARYSVEYFPAGWYYWSPPYQEQRPQLMVLARVTARTAEAALAAARRIYPEASREEIRESPGGEFKPCIWIGAVPPHGGRNNRD